MRSIILAVTILFFSNVLIAQNHGRFWYFGENAGLDFSTSPPTALNNGILSTFESCSAISDDLGNLLFYTDGTTVWNANHVSMLNGAGLNGNASSAQQLIIRNRVTTNEFFVLTVSGANGLSYSVVDMLGDGGLGEVDSNRKNIPINSSTHEKVTAYVNPQAAVNWIITFEDGVYYSYRILNGVINITNPVISNLPSTSVLMDARGMLKLSPDGNKIINTSVGIANTAFLADFNVFTGVVSNPVLLNGTQNGGLSFPRYYGAEFSPDSRLVYLNANTQDTGNGCGPNNIREIFQYEINGANGWNSSPIALGGSTGANSGRGSLQLAPDGKIYFARTCQPWLGVILNPTIIGTGATYIDNAIPLATGTNSREGLPNIATQIYSNTFNTIQGSIKMDIDNNGCSSSDPVVPDVLLTINSSSFNTYSYTDSFGDYLSLVPNGSFNVTPQLQNLNYWTFSPSNFTVNFPSQSSPYSEGFCIVPNGTVEDLEVFVLPLEQARPGFETDYMVRIKNKGNQTASGTVTLNYENDFMTLLSSTPTAGQPSTNQLSWSFSNLQPFQMEEYEFTMTLNTPTQASNPLNSGDILTFTGVVTGQGTDAMPVDNTMVFDQTVVNSYDPNDKTCLQGETIDPADVGEYVHYMIRFENTGTASAINVVIRDEIDLSKFDITTLVPLGGSHDYYTRIREGNVVEFIHEDINLDFNDAANDGHVLFKIKTLNTLVAGDTFDNDAGIYFDFNFPIITNNEVVTVMSTASISEVADATIAVYPNPTSGILNITGDHGVDDITIYDMNGRILSKYQFTSNELSQQIDLSQLGTGVYFATINSESVSSTHKIVVE